MEGEEKDVPLVPGQSRKQEWETEDLSPYLISSSNQLSDLKSSKPLISIKYQFPHL